MRKIDVFNHIFPERYVTHMQRVAPGLKDAGKRVRGVPMLVDLDVRFRVMDAFEDYQQILYLPLFEAMARHDLLIFLHPYRGADSADYPTEDHSHYEIWWTFGWPYDTSVAMARIVFEGLFDRFPHLKIVTHHMGAMAPYFARPSPSSTGCRLRLKKACASISGNAIRLLKLHSPG